MEVIEPGAGIIVIASVTDRVDRADGGGKGAFRREVIASRVVIAGCDEQDMQGACLLDQEIVP